MEETKIENEKAINRKGNSKKKKRFEQPKIEN